MLKKNYVFIKNIFEKPIEEHFKVFIVNYRTKKIEEQFEIKLIIQIVLK